MTFEELPLYEAVHDAFGEMPEPASDRWAIDPEQSEQMARAVQSRLPIGSPWTKNDIVNAWVRYRKSPAGKLAFTIEVGRLHGKVCFFRARGVGECGGDVHVDRIIPGARGGEYVVENCMLVCQAHNTRRGDKSIEDFLRR